MKLSIVLSVLWALVISCNQSTDENNQVNKTSTQEDLQPKPGSFFPVTDFINGQVADIKKRGVNPVKITRINGHEDSAWVKVEDMNTEFAPFLTPLIDSSNLSGTFIEKGFLDQTINAFTFTYDPIKPLPDSFPLKRWDVYVDPESSTVRRIYMLKRSADNKTMQLTWNTNKNCRIVVISNKAGKDRIEKEVTINWDF